MKRRNFLASLAALFAWRPKPKECETMYWQRGGVSDGCVASTVWDRYLTEEEIRLVAERTAEQLGPCRLFVECNNEHWFPKD